MKNVFWSLIVKTHFAIPLYKASHNKPSRNHCYRDHMPRKLTWTVNVSVLLSPDFIQWEMSITWYSLLWQRNQFSLHPAQLHCFSQRVHTLLTGHTTLWHDIDNITTNNLIGVHLLLRSVWQTCISELWLGVVADYGVLTSQKAETYSVLIMHIFKWHVQADGWTQNDRCHNRQVPATPPADMSTF
jgi:hypothetical protein